VLIIWFKSFEFHDSQLLIRQLLQFATGGFLASGRMPNSHREVVDEGRQLCRPRAAGNDDLGVRERLGVLETVIGNPRQILNGRLPVVVPQGAGVNAVLEELDDGLQRHHPPEGRPADQKEEGEELTNAHRRPARAPGPSFPANPRPRCDVPIVIIEKGMVIDESGFSHGLEEDLHVAPPLHDYLIQPRALPHVCVHANGGIEEGLHRRTHGRSAVGAQGGGQGVARAHSGERGAAKRVVDAVEQIRLHGAVGGDPSVNYTNGDTSGEEKGMDMGRLLICVDLINSFGLVQCVLVIRDS